MWLLSLEPLKFYCIVGKRSMRKEQQTIFLDAFTCYLPATDSEDEGQE
jgi:hypothetical protein